MRWVLLGALGSFTAASQALAEADFAARHRASHVSNPRLGEAEVERLLALLARVPSAESIREDELATLKNNAADSLLRQVDLPPGLLPALRVALHDPAQGLTWQEYAVQKLAKVVVRAAPAQAAEALEVLQAQVSRADYVFPGSALLGLARVQRHAPTLVAAASVAATAARIYDDERLLTSNRTTALLVLADYDAEAARTRARRLLASSASADTPLALQTAALGALAATATPEDEPLLVAHQDSPDIRLRTAARAALVKRFPSRSS